MAFQFPVDKQDFKAPNGITYTYLDDKWVVKTYGTPVEIPEAKDPITYQIQTDKVLRAGEPAIELVDSEGYFSNVKFRSIGSGVSVGSDQHHIVIDAGEISNRVDEVDLANQTQNNQINALETQIQILAKAQAIGRWKYVDQTSGNSVRPPSQRATFYGTNVTGVENGLSDWSDLQLLMINDQDLDGTEYTFQNFEVGDKIEVLSADGRDAVFGSIATAPNPDLSYGNAVVSVERSSGGPREDQEYIISVYKPGSQAPEVDLDVLDARYISKFGDEMVGNLKVPDPLESEPMHAANKNYVDNAIGLSSAALDKYLPLAGGTLTGTLESMLIKCTRDTGYAFEVKPDDTTLSYLHTDGRAQFNRITIDSDISKSTNRPFELKGRLSDGSTVSKDFFYMYSNADGTPSAMNYDGKIDSSKNLVNKGFVDNKVPGRFTYENGALYYNP